MGGACSTYGKEERCVPGFGGKPKGNTQRRQPRHRWEENIKVDLQEVGWGGGMDWIDLAQVRESWGALDNAVVAFRVA